MSEESREYHSHSDQRNVIHENDATFEKAALLFKALADPERLKLMTILSQGEACVSELATKDQMSTVSQRLKTLKIENLITNKRQGKHMIYKLTDDHVYELIVNALAHVKEKHRT
jgi:ArsR family transcriptional regulator